MDFPLDERYSKKGRAKARRDDSGHSIKAGDGRHIGRATLISMIGMLLAKGTGFLREMLIVPKFGYGVFSDAYINAFQIPDLIYELLIGGAVAAVLTPTLSAGIEKNQEKRAWHGVSIFMSLTLLATAVCLLLVELLTPFLMSLITGSIRSAASPELKEMTAIAVPVTRILLLQTFLMALIALAHGSLTAYKRFTPVALGPSLYNLIYMTALIFFGAASREGLAKVAWGVVLAALIYFLYQFFAARREFAYFRFNLDLRDPEFRTLFLMAVPTLLSGSVLHLNSIIMNRFANGLEAVGAVTSIRQCITTWSLPYAIFSVSVGVVMLPNLSGFLAQRNRKRVRALYSSSLRRALYMVSPFALAFAVLNFETIQAIFQWNVQSYSHLQVAETGKILRWFCVSMVAQTVVFITNQAFYARKVTRLALFTGILALAFNPVFCIIFVKVLDMGAEGIGMAHALYSVLTAILIYTLYGRHRPMLRPYRMLPFFLRMIVCIIPSLVVLLALNSLPLYSSSKIVQLLLFATKLAAGLVSYYLAGLSIRFREAVQLQKKARAFLRLAPVDHLGKITR